MPSMFEVFLVYFRRRLLLRNLLDLVLLPQSSHEQIGEHPTYPYHVMAPAWVLLDRRVSFVRDRSGPAVIGGSSKIRDYDEILAAREADMKTMKPNLDIANPPEVSRLSMVRHMDVREVPFGIISCTHKSLVLLYAGLPGVHKGYLLYDACTNSVSWIPSLPDALNCMVHAAVLGRGEGSYVLAELVRRGLHDAALYLWRPTSSSNPNRPGRWTRSAARLPPGLFTATYSFHIDMVFSCGSSSVCWVDLLQGVLICDLLKSPAPEFTFVPLPSGCAIDVPSEPGEQGQRVGRPHPNEFRTMGCVGGAIRFFSVVGYYGNHSRQDMLLKTWTLSRDHREWESCKPLGVPDLWASESFRESNLPQLRPSFPVLSMDDAEVISVTLNDIEHEKRFDSFGEVSGGRMLVKAQYMVSLNTVRNEVISSRKLTLENPRPRFLDLVASDFSAYLQGSKDYKLLIGKQCRSKQGRNKQEEEVLKDLALGSGI